MAPFLAIDTGSAIVSVAVGEPGRIDVLSAPQGRSSRELIAMIDELLTRAGIGPRDLAAIGAARGPGSFTGLRVGLATALGLHQAAGVRAGAVSTFEILAADYFRHGAPRQTGSRHEDSRQTQDDSRQTGAQHGRFRHDDARHSDFRQTDSRHDDLRQRGNGDAEVVAVIDALRERWYARPMRRDETGGVLAAGPAEVRSGDNLARSRLPLVGHGVSRLSAPAGTREPSELAPTLLHLIADGALNGERGPLALTEPLYLRSPATSPSTRLPGTARPRRRRPARRST